MSTKFTTHNTLRRYNGPQANTVIRLLGRRKKEEEGEEKEKEDEEEEGEGHNSTRQSVGWPRVLEDDWLILWISSLRQGNNCLHK